MKKSSEHLFLQGNFKKILALFEANPKSKPDAYTLGALVFTGRMVDAEVYLEKWHSQYDSDDQLLIAFFLAVGFIRASEFERGRAYLGNCFSLRHKIKQKHSRVFLYQAFGFYAYFICRYQKSSYWAQKAWRLSILTDSDFGQILSCDLLAHALIEKGEIEKGFDQLEKAGKVAQRFGQGALVTSLEVAKLCYQASLGLKPQTIVSSLQNKFSEMGGAKDTYSKANLGLELARQFTLRGKVDKALQLLSYIQPDVFKFGHRRQKSTWYFRIAYIDFIRGEKDSALNRLKSAMTELDSRSDLAHKLQILGLQYQLFEEPSSAKAKLLEQIGQLSRRVGSAIALKHYLRLLGKKSPLTEDGLGELIDEIKYRKNSTLETTQRICELGYLQLLRSYIPQLHKRHLLMEVLPQALLIFSNGNVTYIPQAITPLLQRILLLLRKGPQSKMDFIEGLWGYQYDSLRHDQLVHAALSRLRKNLGPAADWILNQNDLFSLDGPIGIGVFEHNQIIPLQPEIQEDQPRHNLNYRQIKILNEIRKSEPLSVRQCMGFLKTTKITVNRDLKSLLDWGLIRKSGQGKCTRYY